MHELTHINRRPAKVLVLIAFVVALAAPTALAASPAPSGSGFTTSAYGAPPAISLAPTTSGSYIVAGLAGASETFTDVRADGSYFDPSLGRRVYFDPSLGRRVSTATPIDRLLLQERARGIDVCGGLESCIREFRSVAPPASVTIVEPSAFDWADAGVGAAGTFGLMVLATGIAIVSRQARSTQGR